MAEWLKAHAWKACVRETVPWVRIPLSPPLRQMAISLNKISNLGGRGIDVSPMEPPNVSPTATAMNPVAADRAAPNRIGLGLGASGLEATEEPRSR